MINFKAGQIVKVKKEPPTFFPYDEFALYLLKDNNYILTIKNVYSKNRLLKMEETYALR